MRKSAVSASSQGVTWLGREAQGRAERWKENRRGRGSFARPLRVRRLGQRKTGSVRLCGAPSDSSFSITSQPDGHSRTLRSSGHVTGSNFQTPSCVSVLCHHEMGKTNPVCDTFRSRGPFPWAGALALGTNRRFAHSASGSR